MQLSEATYYGSEKITSWDMMAWMTSAQGDLMVGHDGMKKGKERLIAQYFWPDMDNELRKHMTKCQCQISKKANFEKIPRCSMPNQ